MDNEELASHFSEKLKWEGQKSLYKQKISDQNKQINDLHRRNRELAVFISDMGRFPFFWACSYKKHIMSFIVDHGLWRWNNNY